MAEIRFYWTPWPSSLPVGARTRVDDPSNPLYTQMNPDPLGHANNSGMWTQQAYSTPMLNFGVTTDASRLPPRTQLSCSITLDPGWPKYPSYVTFGDTGCAYLSPQPYGSNIDGPYFWWQRLQPYAFFSYELLGTENIKGTEFVASGFGLPDPYPFWYKGWYSGGTQVPSGFGWSYSAGLFGIAPVCAYVYRPGTGIIGWLYCRGMWGGYGPWWSSVNGYASPNDQTNHTVINPGHTAYIYEFAQYPFNEQFIGDVSNIQDHDILVWEWWGQLWWGTANTNALNWPNTLVTNVTTEIGGGNWNGSQSPLTKTPTPVYYASGQSAGTYNIPDWAPAWGMPLGSSYALGGVNAQPPPDYLLFAQTATFDKNVPGDRLACGADLFDFGLDILPFLGGTHFAPDFSDAGIYTYPFFIEGRRIACTARLLPSPIHGGAESLAHLASFNVPVVTRIAGTARLTPSGYRRFAGTASFVGNTTPRFAGDATPSISLVSRFAQNATIMWSNYRRCAQTATLTLSGGRFAEIAHLTYFGSDGIAQTANIVPTGVPRLAGVASFEKHTTDSIACAVEFGWYGQARLAQTTQLWYVGEGRLAGASNLLATVSTRFASDQALLGNGVPRLSGTATLGVSLSTRFAEICTLEQPNWRIIAHAAALEASVTPRLSGLAILPYVGTPRLAGYGALAATASVRLAQIANIAITGTPRVAGDVSLTYTNIPRFAGIATFSLTSLLAGTTELNAPSSGRLAQVVSGWNVEVVVSLAHRASFTVDVPFASIAKFEAVGTPRLAGISGDLSYIAKLASKVDFDANRVIRMAQTAAFSMEVRMAQRAILI